MLHILKVLGIVLISSLMLSIFCGLIAGAIYWLTLGPQLLGWACLALLAIWLFAFYRLDKSQFHWR